MNSSAISTLTGWIDPGQLMALADATVKSTLLLLAAMAAIALGRKQSPAWRGWVLWLALLFVPAVYFLSFLVPDWQWDAAFAMNGTPNPMESYLRATALPAMDPAPMREAVQRTSDPALAAHGTTWPRIVFLIWALGTAAAGLWFMVSRCRGIIARRTCPEVHRGLLADALDHERLRTGLLRRPKLFVGESWAMPATWGIWRPAILLPREAASWSGERLRHVLWHELAHIVRRDALSSMLAVPATILLWFHPLAWIARRLLNESREAACDDWVLTRGQAEPAAYSADLLTIVRQHFDQGKVTTGLAMAQSSKVGNRVRRLLDHSISRAPLTTGQRLRLTAAGLMSLATATLLISCRTTRPSTAETAAPPINSPLPHGAKLITYEVHFIEKEPGVDWPGKQVPPTQTWIGEVPKLLSSLRGKPGISVVSYPKVTALAGSEVLFKSGASWRENPKPSPLSDPFDDKFEEPGLFIKLCGKPVTGDELNLEVDWKFIREASPAKGSAKTFPKTQVTRLSSRCFLSNGNDCALIPFSPQKPGNPVVESILMITTTQTVNP